MSDVLKGNFKPRKPVEIQPKPADWDAQFEREALKRLGGSISFVSRKQFLFGMKDDRAAAGRTDDHNT